MANGSHIIENLIVGLVYLFREHVLALKGLVVALIITLVAFSSFNLLLLGHFFNLLLLGHFFDLLLLGHFFDLLFQVLTVKQSLLVRESTLHLVSIDLFWVILILLGYLV